MFNVERMKGIMRTTNKITWFICQMVLVMGLLLVLGIGHISAAVYSPYKGDKSQRVGGIYSTAEAARRAAIPISSFQSTSTLSGGTRSDAATPLINTDGSVATGAYLSTGISGPRKVNGTGPGTPPIPNPDNQQVPTPLGDVLIPLLLLASAYAVYKVTRRRVRDQLAGQ